MAAASKSVWTTVSLHAPTGPLDTRSRPADLTAGAYRWKTNFEVTSDGKLCRRGGFDRFYSDKTGGNYDHHFQSNTREPIIFLQETTGSDGTRRLFDGTQSRLSWLNESTGTWTDILTGLGAPGSRWKMDIMQDIAVISNGVDAVYQHALGSGSASTIGALIGFGVSAAKVVIQFEGFMFLMNTIQSGARHATRVRWSDLNLPLVWDDGSATSLAGFQDLDYGDEILAAAPLYGALYIFTRRAIWRTFITAASTPAVNFTKVYFEPQNQKGCLVYPNTLCTDGQNFYYASREAFYRYSPFLPAPERGDERGSAWGDWLYKATGVIFRKADTLLTGNDCASPLAVYKPVTNEIFISWPALDNPVNNWTLAVQAQQQTGDVIDHGFTAMVNYRRTPVEGKCEEAQDLLGVSGQDWAIKSLGGVFVREFLVLPDPTDPSVDVPADNPIYVAEGYNSILRGMVPLGLTDRLKHIRNIVIDADVSQQDVPAVIQLRIGNSRKLQDPNDTEDFCSVSWSNLGTRPLACPDKQKISALQAKGQRPDDIISWTTYQTGIFLYFEITIQAADGGLAIGGDACVDRIDFDSYALPKP
jgi:hypothetical protein